MTKTILITGAGSGIGRGLSQLLAAKGHTIVATDLNPQNAHPLDVTSESDVERFMREIAPRQIDVLINNAGLQHVARLEEFPQEKWDTVVDVILKGACLMTRAVLPQMRKNGFGRIINIGSIHSMVASAYKTAYVAAKHALVGFSKVVALETADADITINTICPSYVRTPLVEAQIKNQAKAHGISEDEVINKIMLQPMPKHAFVTMEEIAATVEFLMSDNARNITGQAIAIDGGWTAQ
jgi:3-hydroxybutyrate dehydrogenase